jgi:hypothetical protein
MVHSGLGLAVGRAEAAPHVHVVEDLDLECEVFFEHKHEKRKLDRQLVLRVFGQVMNVQFTFVLTISTTQLRMS